MRISDWSSDVVLFRSRLGSVEILDLASVRGSKALECARITGHAPIPGPSGRIDRPGIGDRVCRQSLLVDELIDEAYFERLRCAHGAAGDDHIQGGLQADKSRQTLCSACARQNSERNLREPSFCCPGGPTVMATECNLQATAQGHPMDCGDNRLGARLDRVDEIGR